MTYWLFAFCSAVFPHNSKCHCFDRSAGWFNDGFFFFVSLFMYVMYVSRSVKSNFNIINSVVLNIVVVVFIAAIFFSSRKWHCLHSIHLHLIWKHTHTHTDRPDKHMLSRCEYIQRLAGVWGELRRPNHTLSHYKFKGVRCSIRASDGGIMWILISSGDCTSAGCHFDGLMRSNKLVIDCLVFVRIWSGPSLVDW